MQARAQRVGRMAERGSMRQNNKADMTVTEQISAIREKMCSDYCKYNKDGEPHKKSTTEKMACVVCPLREL